MPMTVISTRNVSARIRGFLSSVMLELAPGFYSNPRISPAVRDRVWEVLTTWFEHEVDASIVMIWQDKAVPCGQSVKSLGCPPISLEIVDGLIVAKKAL